MKRKVYLETSIPSFYHTTRTDPKIVARRKITCRWYAPSAIAYNGFSTKQES